METMNKVCNDDLRRFCKEGNLKEIKRIVDTLGKSALGFDERFRNGTLWYTPLHEAAANGHETLLDYWLEFGFDVNCRTPGGDTPLHVAAGNGRVDCVRVLLKRNAEVGAQNNIGKTPRQSAEQCSSAERRAECSRVLTSEGAPNVTEAIELAVNELKHNAHAMLLLMMAAMKNDYNLVQKMFTKQEVGNELQEVKKALAEKTISTLLPLEVACRWQNKAVAEELLLRTNVYQNEGMVIWHGLGLHVVKMDISLMNSMQFLVLSWNYPICFTTLRFLDLSNNVGILTLPMQMYKLKELRYLNLKGLINLSGIPKSIQHDSQKVMDISKVSHFQPTGYYRMKLMLVGKQNRGKTTLAARLQGRSCGNTSTMRYLPAQRKEKADKLLQKAADIAGGFCNKLQIYQVMAVGLKDPLEGVTDLRDSIYQCAAEYKFSNGEFVMGQKIPLSYSKLDKHILWFQKRARQCNLIPIMNKEEFKALVKTSA
eukprot:Em0180g4a